MPDTRPTIQAIITSFFFVRIKSGDISSVEHNCDNIFFIYRVIRNITSL